MTWQQEQERFWQWINRPQDLGAQSVEIADLLAPHSHLSQAEALSIYNNAYHQRLVEVSSALFPVLYYTLGRDIYTRLWIGYMGKYPPRNGPIHHVGDFLRDYVSTHEQFGALPAVADIVQLETLLTSLFDVADEPACTLPQLQTRPPEEWPSLRWRAKQDWALLQSRFDLEKYWRQMQQFIADGGEPGQSQFGITLLPPTPADTPLSERALPAMGEDTPQPAQPLSVMQNVDRGQGPLPQKQFATFLVYRHRHRMQFQTITPALALFLQGIQEGGTFADICERLATAFPGQDIPRMSLDLVLKAIELELLGSLPSRG